MLNVILQCLMRRTAAIIVIHVRLGCKLEAYDERVALAARVLVGRPGLNGENVWFAIL